MIKNVNKVKFIDFGTARVNEKNVTLANTYIRGTLDHMSPELR